MRTSLELAKSHENKTGQWLDSIESNVLASLKGILAVGAGVAPDASSVEMATQQMETFIETRARPEPRPLYLRSR